MPIDTELLKRRMHERGKTSTQIAEALGVNESTYYRKMANKGQTFTVAQVQVLTALLGLSNDEARQIFLL
mgnify:CR=1 FL=1